MYALYHKKREADGSLSYSFNRKISLFGCRSGWIPKLLMRSTSAQQNEPYTWHLPIESALAEADVANSTFIIDLKPNNKQPNLSLYELRDVWGYSDAGWSPILMRLRGLFVDTDPAKFDRNAFSKSGAVEPPIYSFLYLAGSIANGELKGKWIAPRASPTNSALLWPNTLRYFVECIRKTTPDVLAPVTLE